MGTSVRPCGKEVQLRQGIWGRGGGVCAAVGQGLTLVRFSAQLERFSWDGGALRGCVAHVKGVLGVIR